MRFFGKEMYEPTKLCRAVGNPTDGSRRFHPVYVESGTLTRGWRNPEISLLSGPTCGTSTGYVPTTFGGSATMPRAQSGPRSILYGSYGGWSAGRRAGGVTAPLHSSGESRVAPARLSASGE